MLTLIYLYILIGLFVFAVVSMAAISSGIPITWDLVKYSFLEWPLFVWKVMKNLNDNMK